MDDMEVAVIISVVLMIGLFSYFTWRWIKFMFSGKALKTHSDEFIIQDEKDETPIS